MGTSRPTGTGTATGTAGSGEAHDQAGDRAVPPPAAGAEADRVEAGRAEGDRAEAAWVDAGPFRAHLRHLMAVGSLDAAEVAVVLGLSTRAVRHLLEGRAGRVPRRISPHTARRLLLVGAADVRHLRWCLTPAGGARTALGRLLASGWTHAEVADAVGLGLAEVEALQHVPRCNRLLAVRVVGLARLLPTVLDDEDLLPLAPAA